MTLVGRTRRKVRNVANVKAQSSTCCTTVHLGVKSENRFQRGWRSEHNWQKRRRRIGSGKEASRRTPLRKQLEEKPRDGPQVGWRLRITLQSAGSL